MKADLSRNTFDRAQHYSAVRLQQGRIVTDADWNEQSDIARYRAERAARDTIGPCGAPLGAAGYGLVAETNALAVLAVNANLVLIVAEDGALLESTNGGADWTLVDTASSAHLRAIALAGSAGWLVGDGGSVRTTNNRGLTWSAQDAGTFAALRGVAAVDADHAWAVGDGGIVVATVDGGLNWRLAQTSAARLDAVDFSGALRGLAVGQRGAIVATKDGGQTWDTVASGTTAHLHALARVGASHWWAAGSGGTILRSDDDGATWLRGATPSTATLHAIAFRDELEGWAAGEGGTLLHTDDGGETWTGETAGSQGGTLRSLSVFGSEPGWAVGDGSAALRLGTGSPDIAGLLLPAVNLSIEPGRYYVNGMLCELDFRVSYAHQADGGAGQRLARGAYLVYLKAWQRHVSALEAPAIREVALGGPDTATRARTVAQVRALPLAPDSPAEWNCDSRSAAWDALVQARRPRLAARSEPQLAAANLCEIAATAGYRRLENQLYRVEVHDGGAAPSFKWSRENGSVAFAVLSVTVDVAAQRTTVRVAARGRDANLDIAVHDRLELIDDDAALTGRAGALFEFLSDGEDELELVLSGVASGSLGQDPARHPVLRRWDQKPGVAGAHTLPVAFDTWIDLEDGVQVRFEADGVWRPGDYWQIPARTIVADVEWPRDADGDPLASAPAGIDDAWCRLGIVEVDQDGVVSVASDCRELFAPLTQMEQLLYVSGDGQEAAPGALLPQPLALRVARGTVPIAGAGVLYQVETGGGRVGRGFAPSFWQFQATADANGLAECRWTLGPGAAAPERFQRVSARLLDAGGQPVPGQVLVYCATATMLLQTVGGDGQQASAGGTLPNPIAFRVTDGADGVAGVVLTATVEEGGGAVLGASSLTTDPDGYASLAWQIGAGGAQRLMVRLVDAQGNELQRLSYTAAIAQAGGGGGAGACVTIGPGGQFPQLDSNLLAQLLGQNERAVCICFMPGAHRIADLVLEGQDPAAHLAIHGCGLATSLTISGPIALTGLGSLELKDLAIDPTQGSMVLQSIGELRLAGLAMHRTVAPDASAPLLVVNGARRVRMTGCEIARAARASATFANIATECHLDGNLFLGPLSFYGQPGGDPSTALADRFGDGQQTRLRAKGSLHLTDNNLQLLTIGEAVAKQLVEQATADGIFQGAVIQGNTFNVSRNVFVSSLLSFTGNTFLAPGGAEPGVSYGVMLVTRAAVAGNVAESVGDQAVLRFLIPSNGGFNGAANQVFTSPTSTA
jgi:photosystem II stability/assembly factor-like uncharacterized protein